MRNSKNPTLDKRIYQWKGIDAFGKKINCISQAKSTRHLKNALIKKNIILLSNTCIFSQTLINRIQKKHIDDFLYQFYCLIKAKISIMDSLTLLASSQSKIEMMGLLQYIKLKIEKGESLSNTLKKFPKFFSTTVCALIYISENSSHLHLTLGKILNHRKKINVFKKN